MLAHTAALNSNERDIMFPGRERVKQNLRKKTAGQIVGETDIDSKSPPNALSLRHKGCTNGFAEVENRL